LSNAAKNREQLTPIELSPNQINPGLAVPGDFQIEDRDGGQCGDTKAERAALLAQVEHANKPIPERIEVPPSRISGK
jgi:hypothetical protein